MERKIYPTDGLEVFLNDAGSISLAQQNIYDDSPHVVIIELRDVETVRQWLAELRRKHERDKRPNSMADYRTVKVSM